MITKSKRDPDEYKIVLRYDPPPLPTNQFNWRAVLDGYERGDPIGFGETRLLAINDLFTDLEARND